MFLLFVLAPALLPFTVNAATSRTYQLSKGCGKLLPSDVELGVSNYSTINSESGVSPRKYLIHVPESYQINVPVPLILSFHGRTQTAEYQENLSQFSNASYGFEGISVYPEGVPWGDDEIQQWQGDPASEGIDDIKFTMELLDKILDNFCIDPARVYAAGKSNGGGFTGLLACDSKATERIAAFAPVAGAFYLDEKTQELPPCKPTKSRETIPILEFHGWKDTKIDYLGGPNDNRGYGTTTNIVKWVDDWAERNGFDVNANVTIHLCGEDKLVTRYNWGDSVIHYNMSNLKHVWPSSFPNEDTKHTTCKEAEATKVILEWFSKWSL